MAAVFTGAAFRAVDATVVAVDCALAAVPVTVEVAPSTAEPSVTPSVTPETVLCTSFVTFPTTPSTVSVTAPTVSVTSTLTSEVDRDDAGSSSALATAEPSAHAPVTPAAMTMERRMFLFMGTSDPSGFREFGTFREFAVLSGEFRGIRPGIGEVSGRRADLFRPARQVVQRGRAALAGENGNVPVPVPGLGRGHHRGGAGREPQRRPVVRSDGMRIAVPRRTVADRGLVDQCAGRVARGAWRAGACPARTPS